MDVLVLHIAVIYTDTGATLVQIFLSLLIERISSRDAVLAYFSVLHSVCPVRLSRHSCHFGMDQYQASGGVAIVAGWSPGRIEPMW